VAIIAIGAEVGPLGAQHLLVDGARQRHDLRVLGPVLELPGGVGAEAAEAGDGPSAEVHDEEAELIGLEHHGQLVGHHVDRLDG
jgi:hypothetical protein